LSGIFDEKHISRAGTVVASIIILIAFLGGLV